MSTKQLTIRDRLESPAFRGELTKVLPRVLTPDRMVRVAITAMTRTPKLAECDQSSFFQQLLTLAQFGLEPNGRDAHLIPFNNTKRNCVECQLIIDYKGMVRLIMDTGKVSYIHADVVCENDEFEFDRGQVVKHRIDLRKGRGSAYAVYCIIRMKDGTEKAEVMSADEVEAIRKRSKSKDSGPWVSDWAEMAKKTVFKRASKWVSITPEVADVIQADNTGETEPFTVEIQQPAGPKKEVVDRIDPLTAKEKLVNVCMAYAIPFEKVVEWMKTLGITDADSIASLDEIPEAIADQYFDDKALKQLTSLYATKR